MIGDLREVLQDLRLLSRAGGRVADALTRYLDKAALGLSMEEAFGLAPGAPGEGWWYEAGTPSEVRARLVLELAEELPGENPNSLASGIIVVARRYEAASWGRYRDLDAPPPHHGPVERLLWRLHANARLGVDAKWPLERRRLVDVLQQGAIPTADDAP